MAGNDYLYRDVERQPGVSDISQARADMGEVYDAAEDYQSDFINTMAISNLREGAYSEDDEKLGKLYGTDPSRFARLRTLQGVVEPLRLGLESGKVRKNPEGGYTSDDPYLGSLADAYGDELQAIEQIRAAEATGQVRTRKQIDEAVGVQLREIYHKSRGTMARGRGVSGALAEMAGTMVGAVQDPIVASSMLIFKGAVGPSVTANAAKAFAMEAGVVGVSEGIVQANAWYRSPKYGVDYAGAEAAFNTLAAAGGAGVIRAAGSVTVDLANKALFNYRARLAEGGKDSLFNSPEYAQAAAELEAYVDAVGRGQAGKIVADAGLERVQVAAVNKAQADLLNNREPDVGTIVPQLEAPIAAGRQLADDAEVPYGQLEEFDPLALQTDAAGLQFKSGSDAEGVTGALRDIDKFEPALAGKVFVWERADGKLFIADGHQRLDLAKRAIAAGQDPATVRLAGHRLREADGISMADAKVIAAHKNVVDRTGTATDAAEVMRSMQGEHPIRYKLAPFAAANQHAKLARSLANLEGEALASVKGKVIPEEYGAIVGDMIQGEAEQLAAISVLARAQPGNANQARLILEQVRESQFVAGRGAQGGLFGDDLVSTYADRARVLDRVLTDLRRDKTTFKTLVGQEGKIKGAGKNKLDRRTNEQKVAENEQILEIVQRHANVKGPISDALESAAAAYRANGKIGEAAAAFRRAIDGQDLEALGRGSPGGSGERPAGGLARAGSIDFTPDGTTRTVQIGEARITYRVNQDGTVEIDLIETPTDKRGQGAARAALAEFTSEADRAGVAIHINETPADELTDPARLLEFYRSMGFERKGDFLRRDPVVGDQAATAKALRLEFGERAPDLDENAPNLGTPRDLPRPLADSDPLLTPTNTIKTAEREAWRDRQVNKALAKAEAHDDPVAYVMGGGGASGKGAILEVLQAAEKVPTRDVVHVDPDLVKKLIPEYGKIQKAGDIRAAEVVHEESSELATRMIDGAIAKKANLIIDKTLGDPAKAAELIAKLKAQGYVIHLYGVTVDLDRALARNVQRYYKKNRLVLPKALTQAHKGFVHTWAKIIDLVDEARLYDTTIDGEALLLAAKQDGRLAVTDEAGYNRFNAKGALNENAQTIAQLRAEADGAFRSGAVQSAIPEGAQAPGRAAGREGPDAGTQQRLAEESVAEPIAPGQPFVVYRLGDSGTLEGRNAANSGGLGHFLADLDDIEKPGFGQSGKTIIAYEVTVERPFGDYAATVSQHKKGAGDVVGRAVKWDEKKGGGQAGIWYSFGDAGYTQREIGRVSIEDARTLLKEANLHSFDDAGSIKAGEIVRSAFERKAAAAKPAAKPGADLLGDDVEGRNALAARERELDAKRNTGQDSLETGDPGDLFSIARQQKDIFGDADPVPTMRRVEDLLRKNPNATMTVDELVDGQIVAREVLVRDAVKSLNEDAVALRGIELCVNGGA